MKELSVTMTTLINEQEWGANHNLLVYYLSRKNRQKTV